MFTGIIQGLGTIYKIGISNEISIITDIDLRYCKNGSSISCDGICLTITSIKNHKNNFIFTANVGEETKLRSNAKFWKKNTIINLETSLKVGDEIGGHFVYGHVDETITLLDIKKLKSSWNFYFSLSKNKKFIVEKGSISINGVSLTIANVTKNNFDISIISHTYNNTNLSNLNKGDSVNIEFDALARYILSNE
tara:strand:+ start:106 stop:687 length:582 start_codon:yes stop_codon:yes gene_type:complete